jgi:hypothetical protein
MQVDIGDPGAARQPAGGNPTAPKSARRTVPAPNVDIAKYVDSLSEQDARVNAQVKCICRGC